MRLRFPAPWGSRVLWPTLTLAVVLAWSPAALAAPGSGGAAPPCALHLSGGQPTDLRELRGKVVYVDFWASWCTSCLLSFPFMNDLDRAYADRGLAVVGIDMDQKPADAQRFLERHPAGFRVALGHNEACAKAFGVKAMPSSFLIDRRGVIRETHQGFRPGEAKRLTALVQQLLNETPSGA